MKCLLLISHVKSILDEKLNFNIHINEEIAKANKGVGIIRKLPWVLSKESLITIYKSFVRSLIGYGDIIYDQPNNDFSFNIIERFQMLFLMNIDLGITFRTV